MKYFTKDWYETMQKTDYALLLKVTKEAETFSEDYFEKLYKSKEKEFLKIQKEASEISFEDVYPEEFPEELFFEEVEGFPPYTEAEKKEIQEQYYKDREQARLNYENLPPFDIEQARKNFRAGYKCNLKKLKENLPQDILTKVADIRVLALDYSSAQVKKEIAQYCKNNKKTVEKASKDYWKEYKKQFKSTPPTFAEEFNLHDCIVLSCRKKGKDIILSLDNSGGFTNIKEIRFKNCNVIKQDAPLHGAWCLYDELYKSGNRYEIHQLLYRNKPFEYIVSTDNVIFKYD